MLNKETSGNDSCEKGNKQGDTHIPDPRTLNRREYPTEVDFDKEIISNGDVYHFRPLNSEHTEQIIEMISEIYPDEEPVTILLNNTKEEMRLYAEARIIQSLKNKLGVVALTYNKKVAAVLTAEDCLDTLDPDDYACERSESHKNKVTPFNKALLEINFNSQEGLPNLDVSLYEYIVIGTIAVHRDHRGRGLCSALVKFLLNDHPLTQKTRVFQVQGSNYISMKTFEKCGFKLLRELFYSEIKLNGKSVFDNFEEKMKTHHGLKSNPSMAYYRYTRQNLIHFSQGLQNKNIDFNSIFNKIKNHQVNSNASSFVKKFQHFQYHLFF